MTASLHIRRFGSGPRPVLALHCALGNGAGWRAMAAHLPHDRHLLAPDLPGHGRSPDLPLDADLHSAMTDLVREVARDAGAGRPIDVIGHSLGGTLALRLALEAPELVRSLTLFEPVLFSLARQADIDEVGSWLASYRRFETALAAGDRMGAAAIFLGEWGGAVPFDAMTPDQQAYVTARLDMLPRTNASLYDDHPGLTAPGRIEALTMPVLLVRGQQSPPVIGAIHRALRHRLADAREHVEPNAGHMLPISHAATLGPLVATHLEG